MEEKEKKSAAEHSRQKVQKRTLIYILVAIGFAVAVVLSFALAGRWSTIFGWVDVYKRQVEAGLALAELFAGMKKPTVSLVLGGGHSIGVPLAVAAQKSFIAPSATMTIHPVRMNGLTLGVPQTFEYFQKMQQRITTFVSKHSKMNPERFYQLAMNTEELVMDVGTVLDGPDAVKEGLIDGLGSLSDALECLYEMIDNNKKDHGHAEHTEGQPSVEEYSSVVGQPSVEEKAAMKSNHADTKKKTKKRTTKK